MVERNERENRIVVDEEACEWMGQTSSAMPMDTVGGAWGVTVGQVLSLSFRILS